jgi:toxin ParE1/3/4
VKPVVRRSRADEDIAEALEYYVRQSPAAALAFIDDLEDAFGHIGRQPGSGSLRYAYELNLPGLRFWTLRNFPYLLFYVERDQEVDVWRVLHGTRDLPSVLR